MKNKTTTAQLAIPRLSGMVLFYHRICTYVLRIYLAICINNDTEFINRTTVYKYITKITSYDVKHSKTVKKLYLTYLH